jgi:hypothetical protein
MREARAALARAEAGLSFHRQGFQAGVDLAEAFEVGNFLLKIEKNV